MARTKLVIPVVALTLAGLTACGSTVQSAGTVGGTTSDALSAPGTTAPSAAAGDGLSVPGTTGSGTTATGTTAVPGATGTGTTGTTTTSTGSGPITSGGGSTGVVPSSSAGVTDTKAFIGVGVSSQAAAGDRAIGASGAAPSYDTRDVVNAVIDYANKHGGFAGRKLEAIFYDYNLTDDQTAQDQSSCAKWAQDNKTVAIVSGDSPILNACAEKEGAIAFGGGTESTFRKFPHLIDPYGTTLERMGHVTATGLYRAHYFTGKLGLVTWDDPNYKASISSGYMPVLNQHGIKVTATQYIAIPQAIGALGDMSAAVSSAVTKFRSLGIDHVIIQDGPAGVWSGAGLTFEWMNQAKSQHYYPRYGQNTYNAPGWDVLPADQMDNALAIDDSDSDKKYDEGWKVNQTRELCFKIQADAGYPVHSSNQNDEGIAAQVCDMIFMLQRAMNAVSLVSSDALVQAIATFKRTQGSAFVYGTDFFPGRRDGGNMVRTEIYHQSCRCLKFLGQPYWTG